MKKKKILLYCACFVCVLSGIVTFVICMLLSPKIYLEKEEITLSVYQDFKELDYHAYAMNKDISNRVRISGKVSTEKVGTYFLIYEVDYFIFHSEKVLKVQVQDQEAPLLILQGEKEQVICPKETYQEEGYEAQDNYDGVLTDQVKVIQAEKEIIYRVIDSSGNKTEEKRKINRVDVTEPNLMLKGKQFTTLVLGSNYTETGYQAIDNCDGDITSQVKVSGEVNSNKLGTYTLTYQVSDSSGNEATIVRTVQVVSSKDINKEGVIYLTFDDGPSSTITGQILDILKEENIKATFFVIHHDKSLNYLIQREFQEGHTVGLHSYTHDYASVYQSKDAYFNDLDKIQEEVYQITGVKSQIIRFPGGSSNTVSKKYMSGIMSLLTEEVVQRGYHYFDWNVSSGDAGEVHSSEEVYENVIAGLSLNRSNVILMHDFEKNYYTLNALRDIIHYGKESGYTFEKITMDTPMVKHRVSN